MSRSANLDDPLYLRVPRTEAEKAAVADEQAKAVRMLTKMANARPDGAEVLPMALQMIGLGA